MGVEFNVFNGELKKVEDRPDISVKKSGCTSE